MLRPVKLRCGWRSRAGRFDHAFSAGVHDYVRVAASRGSLVGERSILALADQEDWPVRDLAGESGSTLVDAPSSDHAGRLIKGLPVTARPRQQDWIRQYKRTVNRSAAAPLAVARSRPLPAPVGGKKTADARLSVRLRLPTLLPSSHDFLMSEFGRPWPL